MNDSSSQQDPVPFDAYAAEYDSALAEGLSVSGEDKYFFAQGRIAFLIKQLKRLNARPRSVLDFGCGTGTAAPLLLEIPGVEWILGVDRSPKSIEVARRTRGADRIRFELVNQSRLKEDFDLVFCNGVFHHIPPGQRAAAVQYIQQALRPGGICALWENNPWNPGARYVMSRIPFDRDAISLSSRRASRLMREGRLHVVRTDFLFIFPRALRWFRPIEPLVSRMPLGAQYQVLCRKN